MSRSDSSEERGCTLCHRTAGENPLLECLACLREGGSKHRDQAFCTGSCFRRHWSLHTDRGARCVTHSKISTHSMHSKQEQEKPLVQSLVVVTRASKPHYVNSTRISFHGQVPRDIRLAASYLSLSALSVALKASSLDSTTLACVSLAKVTRGW